MNKFKRPSIDVIVYYKEDGPIYHVKDIFAFVKIIFKRLKKRINVKNLI